MDQVRTIDAGTPPARFARGWHCLGLAGRFRDGVPHAVAAFGTKLVIFADSGGQLHVLDGYCRHMGGDLSQGTVKGDAIACAPLHRSGNPVARLSRHDHGERPDQHPLPGHADLVPAAVGRHRAAAARPVRRAGEPGRRQVRRLRGAGLPAGRGDLAAQEPDRQPAAVRRGRPRLPVAPLVRAVLLRRGRHRAGHGGTVRVRDRHHPRGGRLGGGGRGEPRPAAASPARSRP